MNSSNKRSIDRIDGVSIVRSFIDRMIESTSSIGMKVLILDAVTTQIVSAVYSQTEILQKQVYLVRTLQQQQQIEQSNNSSNHHLRAICFVRPTPTNIQLLKTELTQSNYAGYAIYFCGPLDTSTSTNLLQSLATADMNNSAVSSLHDVGPAMVPRDDALWTLVPQHSLALTVTAGTRWAPQHANLYERHVAGLQSLLVALEIPTATMTVRYTAQSAVTEELARDVVAGWDPDTTTTSHSQLPPLPTPRRRNASNTLLLILDRRDDPVTPLLSQWTYQAMVHELLGLNNQRVVLKGAPNIPPELSEVVLSPASDTFFQQHRHANFGQLGEAVQRLLQDYQQQTHTTSQQLQSIADMQAFMDKFPDVKSRQHVVSKHVAILGELSRLVQDCQLLDVSALEQGLACHDDHTNHWRSVLQMLQNTTIHTADKLRLSLLYALRYEHVANLHQLQQAMRQGNCGHRAVDTISHMLQYAGSRVRGPGLWNNHQNNHYLGRVTKNLVSTVQGIDNVYTQHEPLLMDTVQAVQKGKLSVRDYPLLHNTNNPTTTSADQQQYDTILVFMVGGVTYEESMKVTEWNSNSNTTKVILSGSTVHNSTSFLEELQSISSSEGNAAL